MKTNRKKGYFSISAVAKMFSIHQQTVRLYEKEGLISPKRSAGNTRLFSEEDVDRLEEVIYMTHELGINLAGVEMILKLKKQIGKMQEDMNIMFKSTQEQLQKQADVSKEVVKETFKKLATLKKNSLNKKKETLLSDEIISPITILSSSENQNTAHDNEDYWHIEYEE